MSTSGDGARSERTARPPQIAIYPGTFDPVHNGHVDIARRAARLFDQLVVAVFDRPAKSLLFGPDERMALFRTSLDGAGASNVVVEGYHDLTVQYARRRGAVAIIRGLRAVADFEYEYQMTTMNRHLEGQVETVFLMTSPEHAFLSSSLIKEVAVGGAALEGLVPPPVAQALQARLGR
jgi:pantetheine-phosphate adenylyltransferase